MKRQLVFIHGRAQEQKDSAALKIEWVEAFKEGLAKSGLTLPIPEPDIRFPFFGDTLYDLVDGKTAGEAAQVIVRGDDTDEEEKRFTRAVIQAIRAKAGITDEQMAALSGLEVINRGPTQLGMVPSGAQGDRPPCAVWQRLKHCAVYARRLPVPEESCHPRDH